MPTMTHTRITARHVRRVKRYVADGKRTSEIARIVGLGGTTVYRIRQGHFDELLDADRPADQREIAWCPTCRCHVYPPCRVCRLRRHWRRLAENQARPASVPPPRHICDERLREKLALPVTALGLPLRTVNYLQGRGIVTVNDLLHRTADDLLRIPNFGRKSLDQVLLCLRRHGFQASSKAA